MKNFYSLTIVFLLSAFFVFAQKQNTIEQILNPDGTIDFNSGIDGSFNATGFELHTKPNGTPVFKKSSTKSNCGDCWTEPWNTNGINGKVFAVAIVNGILYVGGNFTDAAGDVNANYLAKWDPSANGSWSAVANTALNGIVYTLAAYNNPSGDSYLYIGGSFTDAAGISDADYIVRYNTTTSTFSPLVSGKAPNGTVYSILLNANNTLVYIGGSFTSIGGITHNRVAFTNFTSWYAMGNGVNNTVRALSWGPSSTVYVGGSFTDVDGNTNIDYLARYASGTWSQVGAYTLNGIIRTIAYDGSSNLYFGGDFTDAAGIASADRIVRYNNGNFYALGSIGLNGAVYDIKINGSNIIIGGAFTNAGNLNGDNIIIWNGSSYNNLEQGLSGTCTSIAIDTDGSIYAGGMYTLAGSEPVNNIAMYNGTTWNALGNTISGVVHAVYISGTDIYIGGSFLNAGGNPDADRLAKWDGTSWSALGTGLNNTVYAITMYNGALYVGGSFTNAGGISTADYFAKFSSGVWSDAGGGVTGTVRAIDIDRGNIYIGGSFTNASGNTAADYIAYKYYTSSNWLPVGNGLNGTVYSLSVFIGTVYAGGAFTLAGGNYFAKYDGSSWIPLGGGVNNYVYTIAYRSNSEIYIGGAFTNAGGIAAADYIAKFNGSSFESLGNIPFNDYVYDIKILGNNIYVTGNFVDAGSNVDADKIAYYDGLTWRGLGSSGLSGNGIFPYGKSIAITSDNNVIVGGYFGEAGCHNISGLAQYGPFPVITEHPTASFTKCEDQSVTFSITATGATSYQWYKNGTAITGATSSTYTISAIQTTNAGNYVCVAANSCGIAVSNTSTLTVQTKPTITSSSGDVTICLGNNATFSVVATGTLLSYQWYRSFDGGSTYSSISDNAYYSGSTTNILNIVNPSVGFNNYKYKCLVSGICTPSVESIPKTLTIKTLPSISIHPSDAVVCENSNVNFTVTASGSDIQYQWQVSTNGGGSYSNISGATNATLSLTNVTISMNNNYYRCIVSGYCTPSVTSNGAKLTVKTNTVITSQYSTDVTACEGTSNSSFTVSANGTNLTYTWYRYKTGNATWQALTNNPPYSGTSTNTLTIAVHDSLDGNYYYVRVTGDCGYQNATYKRLWVSQIPEITSNPTVTSVCEGSSATFTISATGTSLTYTWQIFNSGIWTDLSNNTTYSGVNTNTLSINTNLSLNNKQYRCYVSGTCGNATSGSATLYVKAAPIISTQPSNTAVCEGTSASYSISATGEGPLSYQWQQNGVNIVGETTSSLTLNNVTNSMNGYTYRCVVSGLCSPSTTSNNATLTVRSNPSITLHPSSTTKCVTENASFTVSATGYNLTYQWEYKESIIWNTMSGQTSATLTQNNVSALMNGWQYRCIVSGGCGSALTSNITTLIVNTPPQITTQPTDVTVGENGNVNITLTASGSTLSYQWYISTNGGTTWDVLTNGSHYSGTNTYSLGIINAQTIMNAYQYKCIVSGACSPNATSNAVTLTVNDAPAITTQPMSTAICNGATAYFKTIATGSIRNYRWEINTGATWDSLIITGIYSLVNDTQLVITGATTSMNGYRYRCIIRGNGTPDAISNSATLTFKDNVAITIHPIEASVCENETTTMTISASGTGLSYKWQWSNNSGTDWNNIVDGLYYSNSETSTLTLQNANYSEMNGLLIRCKVAGECGITPVYSNSAYFYVLTKPEIIQEPSNATICELSNTFFSITATGNNILYQWQVNNGNSWNNLNNSSIYSGTQTNTLQITSALIDMNNYQYRCIVSGICTPNDTSEIALLTINELPRVSNPIASTICEGTDATFSVIGTGTAISYQWQVSTDGEHFDNITNIAPYSGSTTNTLTITTATNSYNNLYYRCVVTGTCSPVVSSELALLTVNTAPVIITEPQNTTVCQNGITQFIVNASGSNLTYAWFVDMGEGFTNLADTSIYLGSTTSTLSLTGVQAYHNNYVYNCVVSGICGSPITSNNATLTVNLPPVITIQPENIEICENTDITFTLTAQRANLYQWQVKELNTWTNLIGENSNELNINNVQTSLNGNKYRCIVSGICYPQTISNEVTLSVNKYPAILSNPVSMSLCQGNSITLNIEAEGTSPLSYQWFKNNSKITDGTLPVYSIVSAIDTNSGYYYCEVSNLCAKKHSDSAHIVVNNLPIVTIHGNTAVCYKNKVVLDAGEGYTSYIWNDGNTTQTDTVSLGGNYLVTVTDNNGCTGTATKTITVSYPYETQQLCLVSYDFLSGKNIIRWEPTINSGISKYNIYRETSTTNIYQHIGSVNNPNVGEYIDSTANAGLKKYKYKISIVDTCNNESNLSSQAHQTIHLAVINLGGSGNMLQWNHYQGFNYGTYYIYRGTTKNNLLLLDQVTSENTSYLDATPPIGELYYQIVIQKEDSCEINGNNYYQVKSNFGTLLKPVANFTADTTRIMSGQQVHFSDISTNVPTSWFWTFEGGTPASSNLQNPTVTYNNIGVYTVSLVASNSYGSDEEVKTGYITVSGVYQNQKICIVTVDTTTNKNLIVWEKTPGYKIASFNIYRENAMADYDLIANIPYNAPSIYTDTTEGVDVNIHSYLYKISVVDSSGQESPLSPHHKTLHLSVSPSMPVGYELNWHDHYEGYDFNMYRIYRGTTANGLVKIDSVSKSVTSYTDINAPAGTLYYRVAAVKLGAPCDPTKNTKVQSGPYSQSMSNIDDNAVATTIYDKMATNIKLIVYPNPYREETNIQYVLTDKSFVKLEVYDVLGNKINEFVNGYQEIGTYKYLLNTKSLGYAEGIYVVKLLVNNDIIIKRIIQTK